MRENICFYYMHVHVLFIFSLVLLHLKATTSTSFGHQPVVAAEGVVNTCIDKERQALLDFKAQLQDPNGRLSTWRDEEGDCCQWYGVTCDIQTGHVIQLVLFNYYTDDSAVRGEISPSLLNLTYLDSLDLHGNYFHGSIPMFISSMTQLTNLNLGVNEFTGSIPESIGNMTQLIYLDLGFNNLNGVIPESIGSLTKLISLSLDHNSLSGIIPNSIGSLTNLTFLFLSENSLHEKIPFELRNLTNLLTLSLDSLGDCTVENLDWLSSLSYLEELTLDGTSLAKANNWVNAVIGLPNLISLSLRGCDLSQVMHPYSLSVNFSSSIKTLHLDNNNLNSSMYRWLCPLIGNRLKDLTLPGNEFEGKLSNFLNSLSECSVATLQYLDASSSHFTGSLSHEIQHFSSLTGLNLSSNQLDRSISDKLWELPRLQELDLSSNSLRGAISENIGKSNLWYIDLSNNSLEGIPFNADMSNLSKNVEYIDFSSCKLGPRFPEWVQKMKNLSHLDLSNNNISDTISIEYWNKWRPSRLHYLNLAFNNITGALPKFISNTSLSLKGLVLDKFYGPSMPDFPVGIRFLDLSNNKFHGEFSILCQMYEGLEFLDLSRNSLTGPLPDCMRNLTKLTVLNLGHNHLSGRLPPSLRFLGQLETLSLYNNHFSGELPSSLENCTKLSLLDLGANKFIGNLPVSIGKNLSRLYVLSLRSNNFFGTIPSQICQIVTLQILDLSINNLHGRIPSCVNNITAMNHKGFFVKQNLHHYQLSFDGIDHYSNGERVDNSYIDHVMIEWQGKVNEFGSTLGLVKTIDLSSNNLTGKIPYELTYLRGLVVLDLSHNALDGEIPQDIGQMKELLTLNLSRNMFSGKIPSTMSQMDRLNDLDVSYNNLSGRIPSSTQLQSFPPLRFTGNVRLCGLPTTKKCREDEDLGVPPSGDSDGDAESTNEFQKWFYIGGGTGFATAFWLVCSTLLLNRRLRHAFFRFHDCLKDWVYVKVVVFMRRLRRVARAYWF